MGAYSHVFSYTLRNGMNIVAKLVLPLRTTVKTAAEVAVMDLVRVRTSIQVPKVYLYCANPNNPVKTEWILMEYLPGRSFKSCFNEFGAAQRRRTADDLADVIGQLFIVSSNLCGSILRDYDVTEDQRAPSFIPTDISQFGLEDRSERGHFLVGPVNSEVLVDHNHCAKVSECGPFNSERLFLQACAGRGIPGIRKPGPFYREEFEKLIELFVVVRKKFHGKEIGDHSSGKFNLCHNDLHTHNILLDPDTGAITGILDWEMAGFLPPWLAARGGATWFDDDELRYLLFFHSQGPPEGYGGDTKDDGLLRERFRARLRRHSEVLGYWNWEGAELRAMYYICCDEQSPAPGMWLPKYKKYHWNKERGAFPFDLDEWLHQIASRDSDAMKRVRAESAPDEALAALESQWLG